MGSTGSELRALHRELDVATSGEGFTDITRPVADWLSKIGAGVGMLTLFVRHTSASLTVQENTDPDVQADLVDVLRRLAPETARYRHDLEGRDDMPAHIRSMLTTTSLSVPVAEGRAVLGTWQAIYLIEHRAQPHRRRVFMMFMGALAHGT
jgi:secondary thiamine-phosphate synthase enzyme